MTGRVNSNKPSQQKDHIRSVFSTPNYTSILKYNSLLNHFLFNDILVMINDSIIFNTNRKKFQKVNLKLNY